MTQSQAKPGQQDFWRVDDSEGKYHGTFDRLTASALVDRLQQESDAIGYWVSMTVVETDGTRH